MTRRWHPPCTPSRTSSAHCISVVTNTTPIVAYRGAGRPEATAAAERAMDLFAAEIGMDPVDVRRKNLHRQVRRAAHDADRPDVRRAATTRVRSTRRSRHAGYAELRAEQAAPPRRRRHQAARHRRERVRRDHRRRAADRRARQDRGASTTAGPSSTPAPRRTARATSPRGR